MLRWFLKRFVNTKLHYFITMKIIPYIRFTTYYTSMKGKTYHEGYRLLQAGDIILTSDSKKLTTILIGGDYTHASLCISKDEKFECAEMTHHDYTKSTFADICFQSDKVVILRCKDFDEEYIQKVVDKCKSLEGADYDVTFRLGNKFLYCSELVYESDFENRLQVSLEDLENLGRPYISPTGLYHAKNVEIVWESP